MNTLFLAWQNVNNTPRQWYAIGRLDADLTKPLYRFQYTRGAEKANMEPLVAFPDFYEKYESAELFPLFQNRLPNSKREDFREYLEFLALNPDNVDPFDILAVTGGRRQTDNLEVFPKINKQDGFFRCRFFLHGWRHVTEEAQKRLDTLKPDERLQVAIELNNPETEIALQLETTDYQVIGWAPRYLVDDLIKLIKLQKIDARIVKVNPKTDPPRQPVLVELSGKWPADYKPMSSEEFMLIKR